jgi:hypothetical protein
MSDNIRKRPGGNSHKLRGVNKDLRASIREAGLMAVDPREQLSLVEPERVNLEHPPIPCCGASDPGPKALISR